MVPAYGFYGPIVAGLNEALLDHEHVMLLAWNPKTVTTADDPTESRIVHQLIERGVDGIILRPSSEEFERSYFEEIWQRGIPLILIDREMSLFKTDFVGTDDLAVGEEAARHLLDRGHRRMLFLGSDTPCSTAVLRGQGFRNALSETPNASCRCATLSSDRHELPAIEQLLQQSDRPTAIFCYSDSCAFWLRPSPDALGLRVPDDVSIVGCGNLPETPDLTSFDQTPREIGRQAAQLYLERAEDPAAAPTAPRSLRIPAKLIVRGSSGPAPPT